jgi:hypothetical protein
MTITHPAVIGEFRTMQDAIKAIEELDEGTPRYARCGAYNAVGTHFIVWPNTTRVTLDVITCPLHPTAGISQTNHGARGYAIAVTKAHARELSAAAKRLEDERAAELAQEGHKAIVGDLEPGDIFRGSRQGKALPGGTLKVLEVERLKGSRVRLVLVGTAADYRAHGGPYWTMGGRSFDAEADLARIEPRLELTVSRTVKVIPAVDVDGAAWADEVDVDAVHVDHLRRRLAQLTAQAARTRDENIPGTEATLESLRTHGRYPGTWATALRGARLEEAIARHTDTLERTRAHLAATETRIAAILEALPGEPMAIRAADLTAGDVLATGAGAGSIIEAVATSRDTGETELTVRPPAMGAHLTAQPVTITVHPNQPVMVLVPRAEPDVIDQVDDAALCDGPCDWCNMTGTPCHRARAAAQEPAERFTVHDVDEAPLARQFCAGCTRLGITTTVGTLPDGTTRPYTTELLEDGRRFHYCTDCVPLPGRHELDPAALELYNAADSHCERCGGMGRLVDELDADDHPAPCPCTAGEALEPIPTIEVTSPMGTAYVSLEDAAQAIADRTDAHPGPIADHLATGTSFEVAGTVYTPTAESFLAAPIARYASIRDLEDARTLELLGVAPSVTLEVLADDPRRALAAIRFTQAEAAGDAELGLVHRGGRR